MTTVNYTTDAEIVKRTKEQQRRRLSISIRAFVTSPKLHWFLAGALVMWVWMAG